MILAEIVVIVIGLVVGYWVVAKLIPDKSDRKPAVTQDEPGSDER